MEHHGVIFGALVAPPLYEDTVTVGDAGVVGSMNTGEVATVIGLHLGLAEQSLQTQSIVAILAGFLYCTWLTAVSQVRCCHLQQPSHWSACCLGLTSRKHFMHGKGLTCKTNRSSSLQILITD